MSPNLAVRLSGAIERKKPATSIRSHTSARPPVTIDIGVLNLCRNRLPGEGDGRVGGVQVAHAAALARSSAAVHTKKRRCGPRRARPPLQCCSSTPPRLRGGICSAVARSSMAAHAWKDSPHRRSVPLPAAPAPSMGCRTITAPFSGAAPRRRRCAPPPAPIRRNGQPMPPFHRCSLKTTVVPSSRLIRRTTIGHKILWRSNGSS